MIATVSESPSFQGLAFGPQNVAGGPSNTPGYFADKLFAIDKNGWVYCFNTSGTLLPVFNGDFRQYNGHTDDAGLPVDGNFTGLAFSPLDINLWRATNVRGGDAGHGVMVTVDHTRDAEFDDPRARQQALIDRHHVVRAVSKQTRSSVAVNGPAHPGAPVQPTSIIVERLDLHVDFGKAGMACKGIAHDLPLEHQLR